MKKLNAEDIDSSLDMLEYLIVGVKTNPLLFRDGLFEELMILYNMLLDLEDEYSGVRKYAN